MPSQFPPAEGLTSRPGRQSIITTPWGVGQTLTNRSQERVSALDNLTLTQRRDATSYAGSIDVTSKIQSIASYLAGKQGGLIEVPPCKIQLNGLQLPSGVGLVAADWHPHARSPTSSLLPYQITTPTGPWAVDTPSSSANSILVAGLSFSGPGLGTSVGGVRHQNTFRSAVIGCTFNNFQEWAILQVLGNASLFSDNVAFNCLLDRTRAIDQTTLPHGVIELRGTDSWVRGGEYTTSQSASFGAAVVTGTSQGGGGGNTIVLQAGSSSSNSFYNGYLLEITGGTGVGQMNYVTSYVGATVTATLAFTWFILPDATSTYQLTPVRCFAGAFKGDDHWISDGIYELSEGGVFNNTTAAEANKFKGVTADQNSGPGWMLFSNATLDSTCRAQRSSKQSNGLYDDILILGGNLVSVVGPTTGGLSGDPNQPRHGVHHGLHQTGTASLRPTVQVTNRSGSRQGKVVKVEQTGQFAQAASVTLPDGVLLINSNAATNSLDGWKQVALKNSSLTTITSFSDLIDGQLYTMIALNGNTTLTNNASIILTGGANLTLTTNQTIQFIAYGGVLIQC